MSLSLIDSLSKLEKLSPEKLHRTSQRLRVDLGGAEWKMSLCLLATARRRSYRKLGYATITEYAEKALNLDGKKAGCLLGTARALEHLPLLSEAFRLGRIGWGKLRAIRGLVTPETERQWLEFAMAHRTGEVVSKVTLSPMAWKRHQALEASLEGAPIVTEDCVAQMLAADETGRLSAESSADVAEAPSRSDADESPITRQSPSSASPMSPDSQSRPTEPSTDQEPASQPEQAKPPLPCPPKTIRLVVELTPDQYALYERAEARVRAQEKKRVSRAVVVTKMAEAILNNGTARSRAKHQVLIHTEAESGRGWYETQAGPLPVSPLVLQQAASEKAPLIMSSLAGQNPTTSLDSSPSTKLVTSSTSTAHSPVSSSPPKRIPIPNDVLRQLFALSNHQCQECGARNCSLHVHHCHPVSEGGNNDLAHLRVLCTACHSLVHEPDFDSKAHWREARDHALQVARASQADRASADQASQADRAQADQASQVARASPVAQRSQNPIACGRASP